MSNKQNETDAMYEALINDEEQYSLWPAEKTIPNGWRKAGNQGSKEECLAFINEVWIDMRPLSLRNQTAH